MRCCFLLLLPFLKKGTLLAFVEGRRNSRSDTGNIDLLLRRSFDNGKTWGPVQIVADHGEDTIGNPTPVVDRRTGVIWLPLTGNPGAVRTVWITSSRDDGGAWERPREITSAGATTTAPHPRPATPTSSTAMIAGRPGRSAASPKRRPTRAPSPSCPTAR